MIQLKQYPHLYYNPQDGHIYDEEGKQLEESVNPCGFSTVKVNGIQRSITYLIAPTLFPTDEESNQYLCIGHKDKDRTNNRLSNLYQYQEGSEVEEALNADSKIVIVDARTKKIKKIYNTSKEASADLKKTVNTIRGRADANRTIDGDYYSFISNSTPLEVGDDYPYIMTPPPKSKQYNMFEEPIMEKTPKQEQKPSKKGRGRGKGKVAILQIDINTNEVLQQYESLSEAAKAMKGNSQNIRKVLYGLTSRAYGYYWRYEDESLNVNINNDIISKQKAVIVRNAKTGEIVKRYDKARDCAIELGLEPAAVYYWCRTNHIDKTNCLMYSYDTDNDVEQTKETTQANEKTTDKDEIYMKGNEIIQQTDPTTKEIVAEYKDLYIASQMLNVTMKELSIAIAKEQYLKGWSFRWKD